jgi:flagellar motor switch protein FliM
VWDPTAALAALELALGQPSGGQGDVRMFTPIEALMLQRLLASTAASVLHCVQLAPEAPEMVRDPALLGSWRDGGAEADPQRLKVVIEIEAPTGTSTLRVYTPMFQAKGELAKASAVKPALPEHLGDVQVGIAARLAQIDVPLAQLLEIEIGDVIPLRVAVGTQLDVLVEDQRCMSAGIGQCQGKLAVRIAGIERPKSES